MRVNCSVCQQETAPVKIGGQIYCSVCGTAQTSDTPASKRLSLDLSPRSRAGAAHPTLAAAHPAVAKSLAATALHQRVKPGRILDLRNAPTAKPAPIVHPAHHDPAPPPKTASRERHLAHMSDRMEKARQIGRSPHIQKFGGERLATPAASSASPPPPATPTRQPQPPELPQLAATHHQAMTKLAPLPNDATWRPHLDLAPNRSRVVTTIAAVAIMTGYIWLQNYPKLSLRNAGDKAGVTASLPGYLPSSYSLARTDTKPGLVTLNFSSPSVGEILKIAQSRTPWDSSSLLDNYVAKNTDDYSTVQGQGLTIYLFGQNRATWVNRGTWFSIEGTGRLSREQILKIAYSL